MNCKPGDIAVVVRCGIRKNIGAIVNIVKLYEKQSHCWVIKPMQPMLGVRSGTETPLLPIAPGGKGFIPDACLRPLRYKDGQDETLAWKKIEKA